MTKVMSDALSLQVWNQFVNVLVVRRSEGAAGREMGVAGDLVDTETTGDIATLMRLVPQLFRPALFNTLIYPVELPRSQNIQSGECTDLRY